MFEQKKSMLDVGKVTEQQGEELPAAPTVDDEILKGIELVTAKCVSGADTSLYAFQDAFGSVARWMLVGLAVINSGIAVVSAARR